MGLGSGQKHFKVPNVELGTKGYLLNEDYFPNPWTILLELYNLGIRVRQKTLVKLGSFKVTAVKDGRWSIYRNSRIK